MYIKKIELTDYRNYQNLSLDFDSMVNVIYGDNAQGKTNIIEAVYVAGTTKSHRGNKDKEIIRFGCDESHIRLYLEKNNIEFRIDMHLRKNKTKQVAINEIPIKKAAELLGIVNLVFFSPEDLSIIKNGPSERRKFIDMELCQLDKIYLDNLSNYNKTINQRNRILKDMPFSDELYSVLDVYDEQLLKYGIRVIERRKRFVEELNQIIKDIHYKLSGGRENCIILYEPDVNIENYAESIKKNRERDIKFKITSKGPHHDDICFMVNDIDLRKYGSQGQQRTAALSLKLSEINIVKILSKDTPILLLDDVLSELDSNRQNYLLESIKDVQTIITCTGLDELVNKNFNINRTCHVANGIVTVTK